MMIERFIDRLEQQGLLDKATVDELRRKVARSKDKRITPEVMTKYLFDKGYLTRFQATKLINEITSFSDSATALDQPAREEDDELSLLPEEPARGPARGSKSKAAPRDRDAADTDLDELVAIDDDEGEGGEAAAKRPGPRQDAATEKGTADESPQEKKRSRRRKAAERQPTAAPPRAPAPPPAPASGEPLETLGEPGDDLGADLESTSPLVSEGRSSSGLEGFLGGSGPQRGPHRKIQKSSEWDSVLLLVGGASLGVLLIVGAFLYLSLTRGAAQELLDAAESAYGEESYSLAIKRYDQFLEDYPDHESASLARCKRVSAQLWQVSGDPERGLKVAKQELPSVKDEKAFADQIHGELASILPDIARGFVDRAMRADDPAVQEALLAKTEQAMELVNNREYIPSDVRSSQQTTIDEIEADVKRVEREIARERTLVATVERITSAVAAGDTEAAYEARQALLNQYPGLDTSERLHEAVLAISEKQREKVEHVKEPLPAVAPEKPPATHPSVILSHGRGRAVAGTNDYVTFVLAGGTVFALDASTGEVLWHRFVGVDTMTHPFPVSNSPGADAIVVDRGAQEVMRLKAASGQPVWRFDVGEPFAEPVRLDDRLYVSCRSGRLLPIDVATGEVAEHVRLPQPLEVGPGASVRRPQLYQPAEQDNVYVTDSETLECQEVFYVGHKRGTIAVPPVLAFGYLFIVENSGPDFSDLHILHYDEDGLNLKPARSTVRLQGQVLVPPVVGRRRVLVVTDRRQVKLFDLEEDAVTAWDGLHGTDEDSILSYPLLKGGYMWIANDQLTKYQVQATTGTVPAEWALSERDVYVGPLRLIGDTMIHVRRRKGASGFTVGATRISEKSPSWETELGVPVRNMTASGGTIEAVNSRGRLFEITEEERSAGIVREAKTSALRDERLILSLADAVEVRDGVWTLSPESSYNQVVFHRTTEKDPGLKALTLAVPLNQAATQPMPFKDGLVVPLKNGKIILVDATTGAEQARPFHPRIEPATETKWRRPAVVDEGNGFVIANGDRQIYHVGIEDTPPRRLRELGATSVGEDVIGPLASVGNLFFLVTRSADADTFMCFAVPEMKEVGSWTLNGRRRWGPVRVGEIVLIATDSELMCVDSRREPQWKVPWEYGPMVGKPLVQDEQLLLATDSGAVVALDVAAGNVIGTVDVGEPLDWGPVVFQDELIVAGQSGVLFMVARPSSS